MVHENFRFQPWHRELRRQLNAGMIGALQALTIRTRLGDGWQTDAYLDRQPYFRTMPRLLLFETGIHFFDLMRYYGGEIARLSAWTARRNEHIAGEDSALVVAHWRSGARAVWDADRYAEPVDAADPRLTFGEFLFEGSAGRLRLEPSGRLTCKRLGQPEQQIDLAWNVRPGSSNRGSTDTCLSTVRLQVDRIRKTSVSIVGEDFYINGRPTYAGCFYREWRIEGLLLNARMVQATFDDLNPATRSLWNEPDGRPFDAERNTDSFIAQLPEWHAMGLLAVTLNLQGGSPQGYSREQPWINSAFAADLVGAAHALGNLAARRHSAGAGRANRLAAVEQCSNCELAGYDRADWLVLRAARN